MTAETIRRKRDAKVVPHLQQYAPVWLESERLTADKEEILFNVVFFHPSYGWVSRRYRYDSFNDVLYHKGQRKLSEAEVLTLLEKEPYIDTVQSNIPNSYGG
ncbi:MAG: hypothetical protein HPY64_08430 [Anaerolineae bacterium]|nr:hypothetical protein [Anaerolineae bacterium]